MQKWFWQALAIAAMLASATLVVWTFHRIGVAMHELAVSGLRE